MVIKSLATSFFKVVATLLLVVLGLVVAAVVAGVEDKLIVAFVMLVQLGQA